MKSEGNGTHESGSLRTDSAPERARVSVDSRGLQRESALTGLLGLAHEDADDVSPTTSRASGVSGGTTVSNQVAKLIERSTLSSSRKDRLERNRTAAQQCRKRKKEYMRQIEEEVAKLRAANLELQRAVATATTENELLRRENEMYRRIVQSRGVAPPDVEPAVLTASLGAAKQLQAAPARGSELDCAAAAASSRHAMVTAETCGDSPTVSRVRYLTCSPYPSGPRLKGI